MCLRSGTVWTQQPVQLVGDSTTNAQFGTSVSISGSTIGIGAEFQTIGGNTQQGAAYVVTGTPGSGARDFRGIGRSDALLYDAAGGNAFTALSNGNGLYTYVSELFSPAFDILRSGDFNGDGKADLVVYNSHTALAYIGMSNGDGTFAFQSLFWSPGYDVVETGDLNGDGKTDFARAHNGSTRTLYTAIRFNGIKRLPYVPPGAGALPSSVAISRAMAKPTCCFTVLRAAPPLWESETARRRGAL